MNTNQHDDFVQDVGESLSIAGYHVCDFGYESIVPPPMKECLSQTWGTGAMFVRGLPDLLATNGQRTFFVEPKTHQSIKQNDWTIEALPLVRNLIIWQHFETNTLYCYRHGEHDAAFWVSSLPDIRCLYVPMRWADDVIQRIENYCTHYLPTPIKTLQSWNGSGDPFYVIDNQIVEQLPHLKSVIQSISNEDLPNDQL